MYGVGSFIDIHVSWCIGLGRSTPGSTLPDSIGCLGARGGLVLCLSGLGDLGGDSRGWGRCGASCGASINGCSDDESGLFGVMEL